MWLVSSSYTPISWETKDNILRKQSSCVFQTINIQIKREGRGGIATQGTGRGEVWGGEAEEEDHLRVWERIWKFSSFIYNLKTKSKLKFQKCGNISILPKSKRNYLQIPIVSITLDDKIVNDFL